MKLRSIAESQWQDIFEQAGWTMPAGFLWESTAASKLIIENDQIIGMRTLIKKDNETSLTIRRMPSADDQQAWHMLMYVSEEAVKRCHQKKIQIISEGFSAALLNGCGYYQKGKVFQKIIESWRYMVADCVFDEEGFIIDQGRMKELPFGWFDTRSKGCGWIAAFNLLKLNKLETTMQACAEGLGKHALLGNVMGQDLAWLTLWLKQQGLSVRLSLPGNANAINAMNESESGILLYTHAHGGHYAAYVNNHDGNMHFYNAVYARLRHIQTAQQFLSERSLFPFSSVVYVKKEKQ